MQRIDLPQGPIEYSDTGDGPVLLFVHGLLVDGSLWHGVAADLSRRHRCIVPNWPMGSHRLPMNADADQSPAGIARLVAEFMSALDLRDVTLVGNDTGGAVSQIVAADHGERLSALVLTNCDALEIFPPKGFDHLPTVARVPGATRLLLTIMLMFPPLRRLPTAYGALTRTRLPQDLLRRWVEPAARDGRICRDLVKVMRGIHPSVTMSAAERLGGFHKPALLLWSRDDPFFTLPLAERLQQTLPMAQIREVSDAKTFGALDQPGILAEEIAAFAAGV